MRKTFKTLLAASALLCSFGCLSAKENNDWSAYVNPLMGTESTFALSTGNTYPAIARPWGMNFWMPQTGTMGNGWAYVYTENKIRGFKQTHQPSPWINDYGQFVIMPVTGTKKFNENDRASWFSHKAEEAAPYYYKVYLADHDVVTELTPTDRAAFFRFTFPESDSSFVVIDALDRGSYVKVLPNERKIVGYTTKNSGGVPENFKNYFVVEFDKPFEYVNTFANGKLTSDQEQKENHVGAVIGFSTKRGEQVHARVASSFISEAQAMNNLKELGEASFDQVKEEGHAIWNNILGKIAVEGGETDQYRTFYSCLYRSLLFPRKFYEIDAAGQVVHYSPYNGEVLPGYMYTDTGFWDTFRCLFPFLNLMFPSVNLEMQEGLINTYKESGFFPEWASPGHRGCMVGNNSASILADAYLKGVKVKDEKTLLEGLLHGANAVHPRITSTGRACFDAYNKLGYVPCDSINESAARTLEYAYDDWCIYKVLKAMKASKKLIKLYAERAQNYRNLYDKEHKLMRGRKADGSFQAPFSPFKWGGDFTEGNSLHYTWSVFHDPQGLIDLMGGDKEFVGMLDTIFALPPIFDDSYYGGVIHEIREMQIMNLGNYAHGNQPIQHMIYLYNYAGEPWKAQYWLRQIMNKMYKPTPDGYCGDEDNGQTSAWYVFSAMGFYPVCPGTDQYVLGSPLFEKATLTFEDGKQMVIEADDVQDNCYIQSMSLNGADYTKNYITHSDLHKGGRITMKMGTQPNKQRGTALSDRPYSMTTDTEK